MHNMNRDVKLALISVLSMHFAIIAHLFVDYLVHNVTAQLHQMSNLATYQSWTYISE